MKLKLGIILVCCLLTAFLVSSHFGRAIFVRVVPYWVFGTEQVRRQNIKVTVYARHYVEFSNGVTVPNRHIILLQVFTASITVVGMLVLFVVMKGTAAFILRKFDPELSKKLSNISQ